MDLNDSNSTADDAGIVGAASAARPSVPLRSRRHVVLGAAAFLGLALTAGCSAPGTRRCHEMVASGKHGNRMKMVPCPSQEPAP